MLLPVTPTGRDLTPEDAKALDDEFFRSDPRSYFNARISATLDAHRAAQVPSPATDGEFFAAIGLQDSDLALTFDESARRTQAAIDAVALRHHAAEALVRFIHGVAVSKPHGNDARCVWIQIADCKLNLVQVAEANKAALDAKTPDPMTLLFRPGTVLDEGHTVAADAAIAWLNRAIVLLTEDELSTNAANNKLKHGLAVAVRDDFRLDFVTQSLDEDGISLLDAVESGKSMPIFDRPVFTYLSRPCTTPKSGIEAVSLRVDVPVVLAEAWMIANVYAAMFHVAAHNHFGGKLPEGIAPYPRMVAGRYPHHVLGDSVLGTRATITTPPDGTTSARSDGIFLGAGFFPIAIDFESRREAVIGSATAESPDIETG